MSHFYDIDVEQSIVVLGSERLMSLEELRDLLISIFSDPRFHTGFHFYTELPEALEVPTADYVKKAVALFAERMPQFGSCRWAVVSKSTAMFGMIRMAEYLAERTSIRLRGFHDRAAAMHWLRTGEEPA